MVLLDHQCTVSHWTRAAGLRRAWACPAPPTTLVLPASCASRSPYSLQPPFFGCLKAGRPFHRTTTAPTAGGEGGLGGGNGAAGGSMSYEVRFVVLLFKLFSLV